MIINWSICQCCGQQAKQREIFTRKYHLGWGGVQQKLVQLETPHPLYPNLCDACYYDLTTNFTMDDAWLEFERREEEFNQNFVVEGFIPVIKSKSGIEVPVEGPKGVVCCGKIREGTFCSECGKRLNKTTAKYAALREMYYKLRFAVRDYLECHYKKMAGSTVQYTEESLAKALSSLPSKVD